MHFKKLKKSVVSATSSKQKTKKVVHKNRYSTFNNSDESFPQSSSSLHSAQKVVQQQSSNQQLSEKQMVSINAVQQHKKGSSSKQKQHVAEKKETKVELKMSKQQSTKTVIHKQALASSSNSSSKSNKRSRLRRALGRAWKRLRKVFRTVFCCQPWSSTSSSSASSPSQSTSSTWCRRNCFAYVRKYNSRTTSATDDEDDIDVAFERYKRQMLTASASLDRSGNAPTGAADGGNIPVAYDELTPSQRSTIKKLHKNKFWNWNDSVKSTSDKFLESLELDDISCGEASLRKKFTTIARRKQITAFCEDRAILGEIEIGLGTGPRTCMIK